MDLGQEIARLQGVEREYMEYLRAQCELVGASTDVSGCENPRLALAARYAVAMMEQDKPVILATPDNWTDGTDCKWKDEK